MHGCACYRVEWISHGANCAHRASNCSSAAILIPILDADAAVVDAAFDAAPLMLALLLAVATDGTRIL